MHKTVYFAALATLALSAPSEVAAQLLPLSEKVSEFPAQSRIRMSARPIVSLLVQIRKGAQTRIIPCTGALVGGATLREPVAYIVTAQHCIAPSTGSGPIVSIEAVLPDFEDNARFRLLPVSTQPAFSGDCGPGLNDCEDVALLTVSLSDAEKPALPKLPLFTRRAKVGERLYLYHFPDMDGIANREPLVLTRANCRVLSIHNGAIINDCETAGGSSGAILFAEQDGALIGIHHGTVAGNSSKRRASSFFNMFRNVPQMQTIQYFESTARLLSLVRAANGFAPEMRGVMPEYKELVDQACLVAHTITRKGGGRYFGENLTVFFDWDRSDINPETASALDETVPRLENMRNELRPIFGQSIRYILEGHKDLEGSASYNVALSQRMADAVKNDLTYRHGIRSSLVFTSAFGESRPLIATADGIREPLNRRVEISFDASIDPTSEIGSQCDPALADL